MRSTHSVPNVEALCSIPPEQRLPGLHVYVEGYYESGDPGGKLVRWEESSEAEDNGGTVHRPKDGGTGRWLLVHNGVGHYRYFGIFGSDRMADDAVDAMVNDESFYRIEADSDLHFIRRHQYSRSHIELDFNHFTVYTDGIERSEEQDPFHALFLFRGRMAGDKQTLLLTEELLEMDERFEVADSTSFQIGEWWIAQSDNLAGSCERELDKLIQVTEIIDDRHVRFNYKNGWSLEPGRQVTYRKVHPVVNASVRNLKFYGAGTTIETGSQPLAYEFGVECNASGIDAYGTFWPVIMRRYCTFYVTENCRLTNPVEVLIGGTGYLTQQIYCLYGHVRDCLTSNSRHLNDFTGSAYGFVENCHADGDDLGAYVTHGQYEHDLTYVGNSGLMSFANSGPTWGESAKRITVKKHVGSWFIAHRKVTDLTLEDVHVFYRPGVENSYNTGAIWLNADGVQMKNCTADVMVKFVQVSSRSKRPNIIENCSFKVMPERKLSHEKVSSELTFRDCRFEGLDGNRFAGSGGIHFHNCNLVGTSADSKPLRTSGSSFTFRGGSMENTGMVIEGIGNKRINIGSGAMVTGANAEKAFFKRESGNKGAADWRFSEYMSQAADESMSHYSIGGAENTYIATGATFENGRLEAAEGAFQGGYMLHTSNVEVKVDRSALPIESETISCRQGNIII